MAKTVNKAIKLDVLRNLFLTFVIVIIIVEPISVLCSD